jgi:hypothetical protein
VVDGPFEFSPQILTSALRIATAYDYPALRAFTITNLERISLCAVERIRLAREFGLASWEGPAYAELHERDDAITIEEATILGLDAFVRVAKAREQELRHKDRDVEFVEKRGIEAAGGQENTKVDENSVPVGSSLAPDTNTSEQKPIDGGKHNDKESSGESALLFQL